MADINVRRSTPGSITREEPFRLFREMFGFDPFQQMTTWPISREMTFTPEFEVKETKAGYVFKADLPGVREQDIDITVTGSRLTIAGKREEEKEQQGDTYYTMERSYGSFSRSFTMPEGADMDNLQAELKSGVLSIHVPKRPEVQSKKIALKSGEKSAKA